MGAGFSRVLHQHSVGRIVIKQEPSPRPLVLVVRWAGGVNQPGAHNHTLVRYRVPPYWSNPHMGLGAAHRPVAALSVVTVVRVGVGVVGLVVCRMGS